VLEQELRARAAELGPEAADDHRVVERSERIRLLGESAQGVRLGDAAGPDQLRHDRGPEVAVPGEVGLVAMAAPELGEDAAPGQDLVALLEAPAVAGLGLGRDDGAARMSRPVSLGSVRTGDQ
jgi:hypothetical protein